MKTGTNEYQAQLFKNRLIKRYTHLKKWAKRENIFCYRLYDKDIPEIPLIVDIYCPYKNGNGIFLNIFLYKRPYEKDENEEAVWIKTMTDTAAQVIGTQPSNIFFKIRMKQKGKNQYEKFSKENRTIITKEGECLFYVNLSAYLDTGLFLDHRPLRLKINQIATGKRVLNLFCYTGAFSIHAMKGGAESTDSVDLSKTYLRQAEKNAELNGFVSCKKHRFIHSDAVSFLHKARTKGLKWDIIICDPPTFSNSKQTINVFDINKDWLMLCRLCLNLLAVDGILYFSSNSLKLRFDTEKLQEFFSGKLKITCLTEKSIPQDFRNKKIHKLWSLEFGRTT